MIKSILTRIFSVFRKETPEQEKTIYEHEEKTISKIYSLWDYVKITDNTQAHHILSVVGFEEWVPMDEIKRRINELFSIDYKNDRSLYPYIKTLVDVGLLESSNVGGKRKWRKRELILKLKEKIEEKEEERLLAFEKSIQ